MEILFNNFLLTQLFNVSDIKINSLPTLEVSSKKVPSRHGSIFQGATLGEREIEVDVTIIEDYWYQFDENGKPLSSVFNNVLRSIIYYLHTDEPKQLVISDEPNRYYNAICTEFNVERLFKLGTGTIKFLCNDPYMYSVEDKVFTISEDGKFYIDNEGTIETHPRIKTTVNSDMKYLAVITPESVVQIGNVESDENKSNKTKVYKDGIKTLNNWIYGSQATMIEDCEYDSEVTCFGNGEVMRPSLKTYEEGGIGTAYTYKGTQMLSVLDSAYRSKYFETELHFWLSTRTSYDAPSSSRVPEQMGAIVMQLFDINNAEIARCTMRDCFTKTECNVPAMFLGGTKIWEDKAQQPTPKTKRYSKVFDSEDDVPSDAKLVNQYERTKSYATVNIDVDKCPVYKGSEVTYKTVKTPYKTTKRVYDAKLKKYVTKEVTAYKVTKVINPKTTLKLGTKYRLKSSKSGWYCIYLNSKHTSVGWIQSKYASKKDAETENVYVYERKIYPDKNIGKYCDFYGFFKVSRKPHKNKKGDIWTLELYRKNPTTGKAKKLYSKKISESTGTKYTKAGTLAKVGVSFVSRGTAKPIAKISFNHLQVKTFNDDFDANNDSKIIASKGDEIEIDYSVPSVTLNGENFLSEVDIGSRFDPLQPFMRTEIEIVSDANITSEIEITEKFL